MTTRRFSLVVASVALALVAVLLFSGSASSAGKGDRSAPTAPTNLTLTAISETTASFSWGGSTDNSGKFSYRLRITNLKNSAYNTLATIAQTQTSYTVNYLAPNSPYSFAVYAIDGNGNRSADSNVVSASTPADSTPPGTPVLQATVLGPSQVQLSWARPTDNLGYCCAYSVNVNDNPYTGHLNWVSTPPDRLSLIIRHLQPGSTNRFSVNASDGVNVATSNTVMMTTPPSSDTLPPTAPTNLHLVREYGCGEVDLAWTDSSDNSGDAIEYEVYINGVLSPLSVSTADFAFAYANATGDNIFTVKAVDRAGNTSQASSALKLLLWPC